MSRLTSKAARFWPLFLSVLVADFGSKAAVGRHLLPPGTPRRILGDFVRLTLTHNDGGALGIPTGKLGFLLLIVVSFLLGVGTLRFWTFNLADTGITLGAAVLAWWFWRAERGESPVAGSPGKGGAPGEGIEPREGDTHG